MSGPRFCLVLHGHIPFVRKAGVWPFGEEWLFEVMADSYIPLIDALRALPRPPRPYLSMGLTPVLVEQLADAHMKHAFEQYLFYRIDLCAKDIDRHRDRPQRQALARMYERNYHNLLFSFKDVLRRDLVGAFRALQDEGRVELLTSAATHGYLPLLGTESAVRAQVRLGVDSYIRHFGQKPRGMWLPECAYRPPGSWKGPGGGETRLRPGLEDFLEEAGIEYFIVDHHTIEGGKAEGLYRERFPFIQRPEVARNGIPEIAPSGKDTYRAYIVKSNSRSVAVLGRNERTGVQVWSSDHGYPGDGWYREFHKRDSVSGMQYWRVTDRQEKDLAAKEFYEPERTEERLEHHADHFVHVVKALLSEHAGGPSPVVVAPYDTELFGHWWFEGIRWLGKVLDKLQRAGIEPLSCASYLDESPPSEVISLPESSWGAGGDHRIWLNHDTGWMWGEIHAAERWMEEAASRYQDRPELLALLQQGARELLLLESSDWEFLITTFQAREYGSRRFHQHLERFKAVQAAVEGRGGIDLPPLQETDNLFPDIDVEVYRTRK